MGSLVRSLHVRWHLVPGVPRYNNLLTPIKQPINVRWHLVPGVPHDGIAETVMTNGLIRVIHLHALRVPEEQGIWRGCDGEKGEDLSNVFKHSNGRTAALYALSFPPPGLRKIIY